MGDLALIKFGTTDVSLRQPIYPAVCEALILSKFFILFIVYCFVLVIILNYHPKGSEKYVLDFQEFQ